MIDLDEQLRATLRTRADDVTLPPDLVGVAVRRGRRQQLLARGASVAAVVVLVVLIAITATTHGQTQSLHTANPGKQPKVQDYASLPLSPGYVPAGLVGPYTSVYGGTTQEVRYVTRSRAVHAAPRACPDPTARADDVFITTGSADQMPFYPARATSTSVNGTAAKLFDAATSCRVVAVTFRRASRWVTVSGEGRYASVATVLQVAKSLRDKEIAPTPAMRLDYLPAGYPALQQSDGSSIIVTKHKGEDVFGTEAKDGIIVNLTRARTGHPYTPVSGSTKVTVGGHDAWIQPKGDLLVHLSGRLWLEVIARSLPDADLIKIAEGVHVLPQAMPLRGQLMGLSLG